MHYKPHPTTPLLEALVSLPLQHCLQYTTIMMQQWTYPSTQVFTCLLQHAPYGIRDSTFMRLKLILDPTEELKWIISSETIRRSLLGKESTLSCFYFSFVVLRKPSGALLINHDMAGTFQPFRILLNAQYLESNDHTAHSLRFGVWHVLFTITLESRSSSFFSIYSFPQVSFIIVSSYRKSFKIVSESRVVFLADKSVK